MKDLQRITEPLTTWYEQNKRPLPWREGKSPYAVWISEIMLQQTRIEAVIRYYARFMQALPDIESLSRVEDDRLMKLWEGLGYYSRARNLKKAAQMIMTDFGGVFPRRYEDIRKLPGIGEYTAGAIGSICFDLPVPAVDGNVLRVISRLTGSRENVLLPQTKKRIIELLRDIMPQNAGSFNEGLMELGEVVCLPMAPMCEKCPLRAYCAAFSNDLTAELPVREKQMKRKRVQKTVFILSAPDDRIAIEKRPDKGLLSGLYQLPNIDSELTEEAIRNTVRSWGLSTQSITFVKSAKHVFTHIDWIMNAYRVEVTEIGGSFLWVTREEMSEHYPLPTAFLKLLK